jgi:hypothetical protein
VIEGAKYREFSASKDTEKGETVTKRGSPPIAEQSIGTDRVNLVSDMLLAGVVTCGFAMFYNAAWAQIAMAAVGFVSAFIARSHKLPFAVVAFAGAVTMMPDLQMYRALGGSLQLARVKSSADYSPYAWQCISGMRGRRSACAGAYCCGPHRDVVSGSKTRRIVIG